MTAMTQQQKQHRSWKERASTELHDLADSTGKIVIVDFLIGIVMIAVGVPVAGMPLGALAAMVLVGLAVFRKPKRYSPYIGVFISIMCIALAFVALNTFYIGEATTFDILKRVLRIFIVVIFAAFMADGRIDSRSVILGMSFGLVGNAVAFYLGIAPDTYEGTLTGWLNDKNQAGLYYALVGYLLVIQTKGKNHKISVSLLFFGLIFMTGSRTSIAAFAFGLFWAVFAKKLNLLFKLGLAYFVVWGVNYLESNFAQAGMFSNRSGSDLLRSDIDAASKLKLDSAPWNGLGLGEAHVFVRDHTFYFHNSFWTLLVEGGWLYLIMVLSITIYIVFLARQDKHSARLLIAEGAMVLLFVCAWRLGEVFLTMPWGLAMGIALSNLAIPKFKENYLNYPNQSELAGR